MGGPVAEAQPSSDTPPRPMPAVPRDVQPAASAIPPAASPAPLAAYNAAEPAPAAPQEPPGAFSAAPAPVAPGRPVEPVPVGGLPAGPLPPGVVRASDTDRAETVSALRDEFAAGRLSHDTFLYRMHAAMEARHVTDLPPLLADLPPA